MPLTRDEALVRALKVTGIVAELDVLADKILDAEQEIPIQVASLLVERGNALVAEAQAYLADATD